MIERERIAVVVVLAVAIVAAVGSLSRVSAAPFSPASAAPFSPASAAPFSPASAAPLSRAWAAPPAPDSAGVLARGSAGSLSPAYAQGQRATVTGTVTNVLNVPQARVTVRVVNLATGDERVAVTDANGRFTIGALIAGRYELFIEDTLFARYRVEVELQPGDRRTLDRITLLPSRPDFVPTSDRWGLEFPDWQRYPEGQEGEYPFVSSRLIDPYNQNVLKGDRPVIGQDVFMVLTGISETSFDFRNVPTPSGVSTEDPGSEEFFGEGTGYSLLQNFIFSFEIFKGDTAFKPRTWAFRVTPQANLNYLNTEERNVVNISPEEGKTRFRHHFALQEAFGEVKLFDVGTNYDFVSVRAGIQPFTSDFRGFLFRDNNLGVRAFGNWGRNRNQWNVAYFDQLEKETNSFLNTLERRDQQVIVANYYRQDTFTLGYTITASFHANIDRGDEFFFDENGFLVRPAPIGTVVPHEVRAYYAGFGGDGHLGRLNLTHVFYQAFGTDELNGIAGQEVEINGQFAAVEVSIDRDWYRPRATFIFASGDGEPNDDTARGFDAIFDAPNIIGGPFSFWNRQGIRLAGTGVELVGPSSILPSMRSSKIEGQANFVNPGILIVNGGFDMELTPKWRSVLNASYLRFHKTEVLSQVLFQSQVRKEIGWDISAGFQWRPFLNDNAIVQTGVSVFFPGNGFDDMLTSETLYNPFVVATFTY